MSSLATPSNAPRCLLAPIILPMLAVTFTACGSDSDGGTGPGGNVVASVTLTPSDTGLAIVDDTVRLVATLRDASGATVTGPTITWASSDPGVATVDDRGLVTGLVPGNVEITATSQGKRGSVQLRSVHRFRQVRVAVEQACALAPLGAAYCWGKNEAGKLGDGTTINRSRPTPVVGGLTFADLTIGYYHACGLTEAGKAYCWGKNEFGQLGDGSTTDRYVPTPVAGSLVFTQLVAGGSHTCGIAEGGDAYCWGYNNFGQLGDSTTRIRVAPTAVVGDVSFVQLDGGGYYTCGIADSGLAYCWGVNDWGNLGDGTTADRLVPTGVTGGITFASITAGHSYTCALTPAGSAYCWGDNNGGQLGTGNFTSSMVPVAVSGGLTFTTLSAAPRSHTCGVAESGVTYCWGDGLAGELGNGMMYFASQVPTPIAGSLLTTRVEAGFTSSCVLTVDRMAYCWGYNYSGEVGDGTNTKRISPTPVADQQ